MIYLILRLFGVNPDILGFFYEIIVGILDEEPTGKANFDYHCIDRNNWLVNHFVLVIILLYSFNLRLTKFKFSISY